MWGSPNIKDHVEEDTQFRLGKLLSTLTFDSSSDDVGDYEYIYAGDYRTIIAPQISSDNIMDKIAELRYKAIEYEFIPEVEYKSSTISNAQYDNVILYQLILLINNIPTNAQFNLEKLTSLQLLSQTNVNEFMLNANNSSPKTAQKVSSIEAMEEVEEKILSNCNDPNTTLDDWLNIKIPNGDFTDIQDTPEYKKLIDLYGIEYITKLVSKLTKYKKKS